MSGSNSNVCPSAFGSKFLLYFSLLVFPGFSDQNCLNKMVEAQKFPVKIGMLDEEMFPVGHKYFQTRMFAEDNPCSCCVIVHNNGRNSNHNKKYRFKENLLWFVNSHGYYSNSKAKYLLYTNTKDYGQYKIFQEEKRALENALFLGHILNRIVILPKFFCYRCHLFTCPQIMDGKPHCPAYFYFDMKLLDEVFGARYREHVFLKNTMVPHSVKSSLSPIIVINFDSLALPGSNEALLFDNVSENSESQLPKCHETNWPNCSASAPFDAASHPVKTESLEAWLETFSHYSVLRFQDLYGKIVDLESDPDFKRKLDAGVRNRSFKHPEWCHMDSLILQSQFTFCSVIVCFSAICML